MKLEPFLWMNFRGFHIYWNWKLLDEMMRVVATELLYSVL